MSVLDNKSQIISFLYVINRVGQSHNYTMTCHHVQQFWIPIFDVELIWEISFHFLITLELLDFWMYVLTLIYCWYRLGLLRHIVDLCLSMGWNTWGPLRTSVMQEYTVSKWPRPLHKHASIFQPIPGVPCMVVSAHNSRLHIED